MRVFLDFEASSLGKKGFPIEVGWVFEDGRAESHLIKPAPEWTEWDEEAEAVHGISRTILDARGTPHDLVAHRMLEVLSPHIVYASAPSWDGKWLSALLRAAGLPGYALRLRDTEEAQCEVAAEVLGSVVPPEALAGMVAEIMQAARGNGDRHPAPHRALADAERERQMWLDVGRLAENMKAERLGLG